MCDTSITKTSNGVHYKENKQAGIFPSFIHQAFMLYGSYCIAPNICGLKIVIFMDHENFIHYNFFMKCISALGTNISQNLGRFTKNLSRKFTFEAK